MTSSEFFDDQTDQSKVKSVIVSKYFWAWAKVILGSLEITKRRGSGNIAYIDLFAGPGRYDDGSPSTPLLVLAQAIEDEKIRERLIILFNDKDEILTDKLMTEIENLENIDLLKHPPIVTNEEVGDHIAKELERMMLGPSLMFVDPWGYKGLTLKLIWSVLKNWGCDCIIFFNYNRINMGLSNPVLVENFNSIFGKERSESLRAGLEVLDPYERQLTIINALTDALHELGGKYVLPFGFRNEKGSRTTHHLIFISKNFTGYEIMKRIMAGMSSRKDQGVASFEYSPADERFPWLFSLTLHLDKLSNMLVNQFAGQSLTMEEIYLKHNVGTPYIKPNYKEVLTQLEEQRKITVEPPANTRLRRKGKVTFADHVLVRFPPKE